MPELVGEHPEPAVLRLDGVVADPDPRRVVRQGLPTRHTALPDVDAGEAVRAASRHVGVPAVAPDGVCAIDRVAGGLVTPGVHDLEVVDEPVGLREVAVAVAVIAVLDVEGLQVVLDLCQRHATVELVLGPDRERVAQQEPRVVADDVAAVVAAVPRLVEGHLHPVGDVTVDGVAPRGLTLVVLGHPVEVHVVVVRLVVVRLPQRAVVDRTVRLRDLVVGRAVVLLWRAVRRERAGPRRRAVTERRVAVVPELRDHHEDPVRALPLELDELSLALTGGAGRAGGRGCAGSRAATDLDDLALRGGVSLQLPLQRDLPERVLLDRPRRPQVVLAALACVDGLVALLRRRGLDGGREGEPSRHQASSGDQAVDPAPPGVD